MLNKYRGYSIVIKFNEKSLVYEAVIYDQNNKSFTASVTHASKDKVLEECKRTIDEELNIDC